MQTFTQTTVKWAHTHHCAAATAQGKKRYIFLGPRVFLSPLSSLGPRVFLFPLPFFFESVNAR